MPINTRHKDYGKWALIWQRTRDGIAGEDEIKDKGDHYLPQLSGQLAEDYATYKQRAKYVNFSSRVLNMAIGQIFRIDPNINGIDEILLENIDLTGRSAIYFARDICAEIMTTNFGGILIDYSEEQKRPYLIDYKAENIINYKHQIINGKKELILVVLEGDIDVKDEKDEYKYNSVKVWRELYLDNGIYKVREWRKKKNFNQGESEFEIVKQPNGQEERIPVINDSPFDFIPFYFITTSGVSPVIQKAPLCDMVSLNLGHYRNSADYENLIHWMGAATIITKNWDSKKDFPVGGLANFGADGDAEFLQATENQLIEEAMKRKEEQMSIIGAALISQKGRYVQSAQTAQITSQGEYATLADISNAMDTIFKKVLMKFNEWAGSLGKVNVEFNTQYEEIGIQFSELVPLMGAVQSGYMSFETFFYNLKSRNIYMEGWTIEQEKEAIMESIIDGIKKRDMKTPSQLKEEKNIGNKPNVKDTE
jgi:hypothetical protein